MVRVFVPTVSPEFAAVVSEGVFVPSLFYLADGGDTSAAFAAHVRTLPRFELGPLDTAIPSELANLPPDAEVIYRQQGVDNIEKAGAVAIDCQRQLNRRAAGDYTISEVVELLTNVIGAQRGHRWTSEEVRFLVSDACLSGRLRFYDKGEPFQVGSNPDLIDFYRVSGKFGSYGETTTPDEVDAWLEEMGYSARFPRPAPNATPDDESGSWATRSQLVEAFGTFSGMTLEWFANVTDSPGLLNARRVKGVGGKKGSGIEPLFCPYEVMSWLIDPKNKKQGLRGMREETAWRILRQHFKAAYEKVEFADRHPPDSPG